MAETPLQTTPSGPQLEPPKTGRRWLDLIVAGAAISISVISLIVAIQQGAIQQRMLAASSWPVLVSETSNVNDAGQPAIGLAVRNDGAGPALLRWVDVRYDGTSLRGAHDLITRCCATEAAAREVGLTTSRLGRSVLAAGKRFDFVMLARTPENAEVWERLNRARFKVTFDACYCSVLGECWRSAMDGGEPKRVKACPTTRGYRE
jgi:hypothetical protein